MVIVPNVWMDGEGILFRFLFVSRSVTTESELFSDPYPYAPCYVKPATPEQEQIEILTAINVRFAIGGRIGYDKADLEYLFFSR